MSFAILIPTREREEQRAWNFMYEAGLGDITHFVTDQKDIFRLQKEFPSANFIRTPKDLPKGIGHKRQWMVENVQKEIGARYVLMLDDDLQFYARKAEGDWHLRNATTTDLISMVTMIKDLLEIDGYPMVALSARQGNQHFENEIEFNKRTCTAYGVDIEFFLDQEIRFDRLGLMEDFDVTLQILRLGEKIPMVAKYAWGQRGSNRAGGCSLYRTPELQSECAERLAELHPGFVKVVEKKMKTGHADWKVRKDVRVQWKKAYESGLEEE